MLTIRARRGKSTTDRPDPCTPHMSWSGAMGQRTACLAPMDKTVVHTAGRRPVHTTLSISMVVQSCTRQPCCQSPRAQSALVAPSAAVLAPPDLISLTFGGLWICGLPVRARTSWKPPPGMSPRLLDAVVVRVCLLPSCPLLHRSVVLRTSCKDAPAVSSSSSGSYSASVRRRSNESSRSRISRGVCLRFSATCVIHSTFSTSKLQILRSSASSNGSVAEQSA